MRLYQPIWEQLKQKHKCDIAAPKAYHKRIKKAVIKEKDMDLGFKVLLAEEAKSATLQIESKDGILSFKLNFSIGITDL